MILPGQTLTVHVTLTPDPGRSLCSPFGFSTNDPALGRVTITVQANILWPVLVYSPASLTFPSTDVGTSSTLQLDVENSGQGPLRITQVTFGRAEFALGGPLPDPIPPGRGVYLPITFTPASVGSFYSSVTLTTNDPNHRQVTLNLSGKGTSPGTAKTRLDAGGQ